jgi:hypothetical protein
VTVASDFRARVEQAVEGTPYVVRTTDAGFDLTIDVVDAQWWGLLNRAGLRSVCTQHVTFPRAGTFTVVDDIRTVEWSAGRPTYGSVSGFRGRVVGVKREKIWALDDHGRFGVVADYTFRPQEGRDLLEAVGRQLGLRQRRGTSEAIGLYVGLAGAIGALITLVVLAVASLTGQFG